MEKIKEQRVIFQLIRSVLMEEKPDISVEGLDWQYMMKLCRYQKIDHLVAYAVSGLQGCGEIPADVKERMLKAQQKGVAREVTQYFSLQEIQQRFEESGIENLPLKGAQLKNDYPSPDMRFLTDLDILCPLEKQEEIKGIMESLGYVMDHGGGHHDVYVRKPFMTVEIHWICSTENDEMDAFLCEVWNRCEKVEGCQMSYRMPWEDYYVYMIGHLAKHMRYGGIGIRMLLDLFVFERKRKSECDWKYVEEHLEQAGLLRFAHTMQAFLWKCMTEEEDFFEKNILLEHLIGSGAYGTMENHTGMRLLKDGGKKSRIFQNRIRVAAAALFPSPDAMKQLFPMVKKYPFLLPAAWIWRLLMKAIFANKKGCEVLKNVVETKQVAQMDQVCRAAGLYQ